MPDKLPSLFDFDDEDFPPNPEEKEPNATEEQPGTTADSIPEEEPKAFDLTGEKREDEAWAKENSLPDPSDEILEVQEKTLNESLPKHYTKPKLELPGQPDGSASLQNAPAFDKQIGNAPQQKVVAFTFEPRKVTKAEEDVLPQQPASEETKDTESGTLQDEEKEVEVEGVNIDNQEVIIAPLPEWTLDKNYYTIGEVAQLFEVNVSHIRFWTTEFKMKTRTTRKGDRLFTPTQIGELRLIHHLVKVKKYTLRGAKEILKSGNVQLEKKLNLKEELQKLYQELSALKDSL